MTIGAAAEWERRHKHGWVAAVRLDSVGAYHYVARNTATEETIAAAWETATDLPSAQEAADELVAPHECDCPGWADVTAKVLVQVKCAADHDIAATYTNRELEQGLSTGSLRFYCNRCDVERGPTADEQAAMLRRLQDSMP